MTIQKEQNVKLIDECENSTVIYVQPTFPFAFPKDVTHQNGYLKDARKIIDTASKEMNPMGLERLLAAMIIEIRGNNYRGKHN